MRKLYTVLSYEVSVKFTSHILESLFIFSKKSVLGLFLGIVTMIESIKIEKTYSILIIYYMIEYIGTFYSIFIISYMIECVNVPFRILP